MGSFWTLITDVDTVAGKSVTTAAIVVGAAGVASLFGRLAARRTSDRYRKYFVRKVVRYAVAVVALIGTGILWRPFAGQLGLVLGLVTAGIAFALQEVIGAVAGWFNVLSGQVFKVGDRVQIGGVQGDVIDITPLRTKVMEIGSDRSDDTWVRGRQHTGRIVAVSNKVTFTDPVFNYSSPFEFIWEELTIPVAYQHDWRRAETILLEESVAISAVTEAEHSIADMIRRYPVPRTEVETRVFVRATDNYLELAARFVVPVRTARSVKDQLTRRVLMRFEEEGIAIASTTQDVTVRLSEHTPPAETGP